MNLGSSRRFFYAADHVNFSFSLPYLCFIHEKANFLLYFGLDVHAYLEVAISEVSGPLVFHMKALASC